MTADTGGISLVKGRLEMETADGHRIGADYECTFTDGGFSSFALTTD